MAAAQALLLIAFPAIVYFGLGITSPRAIALASLALVGLRFIASSRARVVAVARVFAPGPVAFALTSASALVFDHPLGLLLAPALFNLAMLGSFGFSFAQRETAVETLARAQVGELLPEEPAYCRRVTLVWCAFFAANGAISASLALRGTRESWALYNGLIAYLAMGALFAGEYVVRVWRFRRYVGSPVDPLLRRIFPPKAQ